MTCKLSCLLLNSTLQILLKNNTVKEMTCMKLENKRCVTSTSRLADTLATAWQVWMDYHTRRHSSVFPPSPSLPSSFTHRHTLTEAAVSLASVGVAQQEQFVNVRAFANRVLVGACTIRISSDAVYK